MPSYRFCLVLAAGLLCLGLSTQKVSASDLEKAQLDQFIADAFTRSPVRKTLWLNAELKADIAQKLDYRFRQMRLRYWVDGDKTAWILEEIGKEQLITMGIVINAGRIEQFQVLKYRESRGGEIQRPYFTRQFAGLGLEQGQPVYRLDQSVDGITGATLSVRAAKKVAMLALYLHALQHG